MYIYHLAVKMCVVIIKCSLQSLFHYDNLYNIYRKERCYFLVGFFRLNTQDINYQHVMSTPRLNRNILQQCTNSHTNCSKVYKCINMHDN